MHIRVLNNIAATKQTRAYAEYRVFAGLACFSRLVQDVEVHLNSSNGDGADVSCLVSVYTTSGKRARVRARGSHAYDAINRAAERIGQRLWEVANAETLIRDAR
jgi:ribosome-associated translation inhibitor RaiA